jgi:DNA-binding transcriptional regulator YiaG
MDCIDIKAARGDLSTREFARRLGVSKTLYLHWENGRRTPAPAHIMKLEATAKALRMVPKPVPTEPSDDDPLTLAQCCKALNLKSGSDKTLRKALKARVLPFIQRLDPRNRPQYFIRRGDLLAWYTTHRQAHRDPRGGRARSVLQAKIITGTSMASLVDSSAALSDRHLDGRDVRAIRQILKITQVALAETLGVREDTVKKWEGGRYDPAPKFQDALRRLARGLALPTPAPAKVVDDACIWRRKGTDPVVETSCPSGPRLYPVSAIPTEDTAFRCPWCQRPPRVERPRLTKKN